MVKPRFVKEIRYHGKLVKRFDTEVLQSSVCSRSTLRKVRKMLEGVVETGTAKNLKNPRSKLPVKPEPTRFTTKNTVTNQVLKSVTRHLL